MQLKTAAALNGLAKQAEAHRDLLLTGRTHNVPAQPTTLGKRIAMFGEELLSAYTRLSELVDRYPVRGLKGAVGTQLDQLTLLGGDNSKVDRSRGWARRKIRTSTAASTIVNLDA